MPPPDDILIWGLAEGCIFFRWRGMAKVPFWRASMCCTCTGSIPGNGRTTPYVSRRMIIDGPVGDDPTLSQFVHEWGWFCPLVIQQVSSSWTSFILSLRGRRPWKPSIHQACCSRSGTCVWDQRKPVVFPILPVLAEPPPSWVSLDSSDFAISRG